ncbi:tetratricopeptide repeat protein [Novipirellula artificiosorum]|uniref:Tetratricopeptide repeat protein n=1 Tax=Novipirellula artificiosorum TaxID=2528016 RepID=A0A5C6D3I6_9BACT|nr:tetratricopeptide repeat protein [Novipirellula artificiosorum]TWU31318.1 Tetratricopeptide repeat protein [Novipirellula artificiosorum]
MSKEIIVLFRDSAPVVHRISETLSEYFSSAHLRCENELPQHRGESQVVIALLSQDSERGPTPGLPLDDFDAMESTGIADAFGRDSMRVIPVLLDRAVMPVTERIPSVLQPLTFQHALRIRTDKDLQRDIGRLVSDLEEHLDEYPDDLYPWDYWLLPIGLIGCLLFLPFLGIWMLEAWYWSDAYENLTRFQEARFVFEGVGLAMLGLFVFLAGCGFFYRRYRIDVGRQCDYFRSGSGEPLLERNWMMAFALLLAISSLAWGWWSVGLAVLLGIVGLWKYGSNRGSHPWPIFAAVIALSVASIVHFAWRKQTLDRLGESIALYERGMQSISAGDLENAEALFAESAAAHEAFGHSYQGLGEVHRQRGDPTQAIAAFTKAVECYPTSDSSLIGPDHERAALAYLSRGEIYREQNQIELADQDQESANDLDPWLQIFHGILRFW